ncbi:hypothetical protein DRE_03853 [Drechslerella stenobrocha 248]|uniref:Uncharacterized protein n=1 Tax=Drechslerella stenobrocha 248 TaxID=1043628 RepID=W7HRZ3_9PEZI|nr:hypothetical protein DRE_03853 [Drechslerella stenobrocha 248]
MAFTNRSFAIDKYSYSDVAMSQYDAKPSWNHHAARDHIYLVLGCERPLEQPSARCFPYMNKLTLKIIWRAETLECLNISEILHQKSNYIDCQNMVGMIRCPSLALKYVNLRTHTLRRIQVRFCNEEDFHAVKEALESAGCPVQHHNAETAQNVPKNTLGRQFSRPGTSASLLTGYGDKATNSLAYPRPGTLLPQLGTTQNLSRGRTLSFAERLALAAAHTPQRQYSTPQLSAPVPDAHLSPFTQAQAHNSQLSQSRSSNLNIHDTMQSSPPSSQLYLQQPSMPPPGGYLKQQYRPEHSQHPFANTEEPFGNPASHHFNTHLTIPKRPDFYGPAHLRRGSSSTSSLLSRPQTATSITNSIPASRGTLTSVETLFSSNSQAQNPFHRDAIAPSQRVVNPDDLSSQRDLDSELANDGLPPPRRLPDFDKLNKVHGDKALPSSSTKLTGVFKNSKNGSPVSTSLKRKSPNNEDELHPVLPSTATGAGTGGKGSAKRVKLIDMLKEPAAVPQPEAQKTTSLKLTAPKPTARKPAASKKPPAPKASVTPKPRKTTVASSKATTPKKRKPKSTIPPKSSSANSIASPAKILQIASPSSINNKAKALPQLRQTTLELSKLEALAEMDTNFIDENLLAEMIHSDKHLKIVQRLERVWAKIGFEVRVKASRLFEEALDDDSGNKREKVNA